MMRSAPPHRVAGLECPAKHVGTQGVARIIGLGEPIFWFVRRSANVGPGPTGPGFAVPIVLKPSTSTRKPYRKEHLEPT